MTKRNVLRLIYSFNLLSCITCDGEVFVTITYNLGCFLEYSIFSLMRYLYYINRRQFKTFDVL